MYEGDKNEQHNLRRYRECHEDHDQYDGQCLPVHVDKLTANTLVFDEGIDDSLAM